VIRRFQIEDLIVQDSSGVVFRAHDAETGKSVALRRFFPFGIDGGGLHADEQTAYNIALQRLAGLSHPSLRSVVCGGCDPVDGMPFIATEWIEGESLSLLISGAPLSTDSAVHLITQALEVSELLSHVLAEEAVWVETELSTIVVGTEESGRGFTFWISPLKWLGGKGEHRGLESIISLTEEIMGWKGRVVNDQAGRGLGGWLNWLRSAATTTSLMEARESLAASVGEEPPPPVRKLVVQATSPTRRGRIKKPSSKAPIFAALTLIVASAGLGTWIWKRKKAIETGELLPISPAVEAPAVSKLEGKPVAAKDSRKSAPKDSPKPAPSPVATPEPVYSAEDGLARANRLAAELSAKAEKTEKKVVANLAEQQATLSKQGGIHSPQLGALLLQQKGKEAKVEGVFEKVGFSGTRKTMYLVFTGDNGASARGSIVLSKAPADLKEDALIPLFGKKIRITGKVEAQKGQSEDRPLIEIKDRASIQVIE
jgi:hypothetical protein